MLSDEALASNKVKKNCFPNVQKKIHFKFEFKFTFIQISRRRHPNNQSHPISPTHSLVCDKRGRHIVTTVIQNTAPLGPTLSAPNEYPSPIQRPRSSHNSNRPFLPASKATH